MDLDARQTRRVFLAGTVALPLPFPSIGAIAFEPGSLTYSRGQKPKTAPMVVVHRQSRGRRSVMRVVLQSDVAALFIPGQWRGDGFRISRRKWVNDFDRGEWFVESDVDPDTVRKRLKLTKDDDITTRDSILRGLAFVAETRPVVTVSEITTSARDARDVARRFCTPDKEPEQVQCTCDTWCTCECR